MIYDVSGNDVFHAYDKAENIDQTLFDADGNPLSNERTLLDSALITALPSCSVSGTKQGGCTDGEYLYQTSGDTSSYTYMRIIKYKIADGTYSYVQFDGYPNFGHANDMAYNPNSHCLYIPTMLEDGSVIVLDADDLSYIKTAYITKGNGDPFKVWQLCFDRVTNHFFSGFGSRILVYDQSLNYLEEISIPAQLEATDQGCETDGTYFYRLFYNPNQIDIIRISTGERVMIMPFTLSGEPEAIMYDWNGHFFISKFTTGEVFYRAQLFEEGSA